MTVRTNKKYPKDQDKKMLLAHLQSLARFFVGPTHWVFCFKICLQIKRDPSLRAPRVELCVARSNLLCMV